MRKTDVVTDGGSGSEEVDPPARCPHGRCLHEVDHKGKCLFDDDSAKYREKRDAWRQRAIEMMESRVGKVGKPSKLSREKTIGDIAEHCGVSRQTLYVWRNKKHNPKKKKQKLNEEQAAQKNEQKSIKVFTKAAEWVAEAAAPDTLNHIKANPEALNRACALKQLAIASLEAIPFPPSSSGDRTVETQATALAHRLAKTADIAIQEATALGTLLAGYDGEDEKFLSDLQTTIDGARGRFEKAIELLDASESLRFPHVLNEEQVKQLAANAAQLH